MGGVAATAVSTDASLLFLQPESTESLILRSQSTELCVSLMALFKMVGLTQIRTGGGWDHCRKSDAQMQTVVSGYVFLVKLLIPRINLTAYL